MRKLIIFNLLSLDGFHEGPGHTIDWHHAVDEEFNEFAMFQERKDDHEQEDD